MDVKKYLGYFMLSLVVIAIGFIFGWSIFKFGVIQFIKVIGIAFLFGIYMWVAFNLIFENKK